MTILVMMGVSGSGKTTIGKQLADRLGWPFKEGDDLHPAGNIAKMTAGVPLTDADRAPWLAAVADWIDSWRDARCSGVIACSALKHVYRQDLARGRPQVRFVYLKGEQALLSARLAQRRGHFMPPKLLKSQLAVLEEPTPDEGVIVIDTDQSIEAQIDAILQDLDSAGLDRARLEPARARP